MVELLLAAFIMSVGLLGLLSLQVVSMAQGHQSRQRGTATFLAHNLLDRAVAEGLVSSSERYDQEGTLSTSVFRFTDPLAFTAHTSTTAENLFFDLNGAEVPATDPSVIFTVSYQRFPGVKAGFNYAYQNIVVNVEWKESVKVNGAATLQSRYFSASRNVRL
jgi:type IV pilus modification protein PilV